MLWRKAHAWLQGWSDAAACRPLDPQSTPIGDAFPEEYEKGWRAKYNTAGVDADPIWSPCPE